MNISGRPSVSVTQQFLVEKKRISIMEFYWDCCRIGRNGELSLMQNKELVIAIFWRKFLKTELAS